MQTCHHDYFWIDKFKNDSLPLLFVETPTNFNEWIYSYIKTLKAYTQAIKLLQYDSFNVSYDEEKSSLWIPEEILNNIYHIGINELVEIRFERNLVTHEYKLIQYFIQDEEDETDYNDVVLTLNKNSYVMYLTLLMYYDPHVELIDDEGDLIELDL